MRIEEGEEKVRTRFSIFNEYAFPQFLMKKIFRTEVLLVPVFVFFVTLKGMARHKECCIKKVI